MINDDVRQYIVELEMEDCLIFEDPAYDNSIIGFSHDGRVIYDMENMIVEFMEDNGCSAADAVEFIEYNTLGSLSSASGKAPIVMYVPASILSGITSV